MNDTPNPNQSWFDVDGDNTLALDWDLQAFATVWEIGGFEGRWARQMYNKVRTSFIHIFEPQLWAAQKLVGEFEDETFVRVYPYGLIVTDKVEWEVLPIGDYHTDGASLIKPGVRDTGLGVFRDYTEIMPPIGQYVD